MVELCPSSSSSPRLSSSFSLSRLMLLQLKGTACSTQRAQSQSDKQSQTSSIICKNTLTFGDLERPRTITPKLLQTGTFK